MNVPSLHALAFLRGSIDRSARRATSSVRGRSAHSRRRRGLSRFEQLEARLALAVTVTNTNDTGAGSLREAITKVNTAATANTITFQDLAGLGTARPHQHGRHDIHVFWHDGHHARRRFGRGGRRPHDRRRRQ